MPKPAFFRGLGLFVSESFLDPELCARIVAESGGYPWQPARALSQTGDMAVDERVRKAFSCPVPEPHNSTLGDRLIGIKPVLEAHYGLQLSGYETPNVLRYSEGCFLTAHTDNQQVLSVGEQRQVCLSVFLNGPNSHVSPGCYGGGSLVFYGLLPNAKLCNYGFPLEAESGALVAFRPTVTHEVEAVTWGERLAIVTCFY